MPAYIAERYNSRPGNESDSPSADLIYIIKGTNDDIEVRELADNASPDTYLGLDKDSLDIDPQGGGVWFATVRYQLLEIQGDYEFDTSGGTQRLATSLGTISRQALPGYEAPNFGGAINVNEDRVEGVDITVPIFNFSQTRYLSAAFVDDAFKYNIFQLTGRVNNDAFKGFAKGEVLFLGASGTKRGREKWAITYKCAASPNIVNMPLGHPMLVDENGDPLVSAPDSDDTFFSAQLMITKEGWHHLWVRFEDDIQSNTLIKRPVAAYVEQVYPYGDLSALGI